MTARSRKTYLVMGGVLIVLVAMAALSAYGRSTVEPAAQAVAAPRASLTVAVEKVRSEAIASSISATGTVAAWQEATIGAETSSLKLTELLVGEGDHVRAGDVVARLDASVLKAQLAEQKAAVDQAQATLDAAVSAAGRADRLLASKAISAETAEDKATAVKTGRASVEQAKAAADRLQAELDQATIRAPFDGIVSSRPAVAGSIVQAGTELMKIIRDGRLEVGVLVPEKDLPAISVGQAASVVDASGRTFAGSVSSIAQTVSSTTRLATVYVALGEGSGLKPACSPASRSQAPPLRASASPRPRSSGRTANLLSSSSMPPARPPPAQSPPARTRTAASPSKAGCRRATASWSPVPASSATAIWCVSPTRKRALTPAAR
ncbi:efflux RND transporter periplasmic adaptor subunit [Mesorhizobium sp. NZP2077]|uniref:efflux RND transporter periplasmic adaptor subunit n=1 Tax=Mesorhizobium sp. NZP2077 TaxID=2483404 RepID=UPI00155242E5|nr:efflux RND transporter periplasmic adaptor subunit [Mesorhizobium sp. NZP2077]QKC82813.1 efflux RND transporter periplasmic adaptor subunit [Mesorhizobium sp. NZP2077]QKD16309.1 efflux RND transporter periplasmic adaptor subunit [Mesorhizobium sp. NZP2077]